MNIKDIRLKTEIEKLIKEFLQKGILPTSDELTNHLKDRLYSKNLNLPFFEFEKQDRQFNLENLNKTKEKVAYDLKVANKAILNLYKEIELLVSKFESEKERAEYKASKLENEILNFIGKSASSGYIESYREDFVDMTNIDLAQTNAYIDLYAKEAALKIMKEQEYGDFTIHDIKYGAIESDGVEPVEVINMNRWMQTNKKPGENYKIELKSKIQKPVYLSFVIDLGGVYDVNTLELNLPMLKEYGIEIKCWASTDSEKEAYTKTAKSDLNTLLDIQNKVRYIQVKLTKEEADKRIGIDFSYMFIFDYIKVYYTKYANQSTIVTTPIKFKNPVNKIALVTKESIPGGTSIDYYISNNIDKPQWQKIEPYIDLGNMGTTIEFNSLNKDMSKTFKLDNEKSREAYKVDTSSLGYNIYLLGEVAGNISNHKLYKGVNSWKVEELKIENNTVGIDNSIFVGAKTTSVTYKPISGTKVMYNETYTSPHVLRYTSNIKIAGSSKRIKKQVVSNFPLIIYLNGKRIHETDANTISSQVVFPFIEGINKLEVVIAVRNPSGTGGTLSPTVDIGFNPTQVGTIVGEQDSMKEVSYFDLLNNSNGVTNVYAVEKDSDGVSIYIKDYIFESYKLTYDSRVKDNRELLFKAEMNKSVADTKVTPKIFSYEIRSIK